MKKMREKKYNLLLAVKLNFYEYYVNIFYAPNFNSSKDVLLDFCFFGFQIMKF